MRPLLEAARGRLSDRRVIAVVAGKGGVGKSIVAALLALKRRAPLVDLDLFGMAVPRLFGLTGRLHEVGKEGIEPLQVGGIKIFSLGGIVGDRYVVLPGSNQGGIVEALLAFLKLGPEDREVVVDMPPGMGEELLSLSRVTKFTPVVVSTPSAASYGVVKNLVDYLGEIGLRPAAVALNMAYVECGGQKVYPFGSGERVRTLAESLGVPLVEIPIEPRLEEYIGRIHEYRGPLADAVGRLSEAIR